MPLARILAAHRLPVIGMESGFVRLFVGLLMPLALMMTISAAHAQQWQRPDQRDTRQGSVPSDPRSSVGSNDSAADRELRRERKMRWLDSANGSAGGDTEAQAGAGRGRMTGLSREERYRLRSDIREAGYSAYAPETDERRERQSRVNYDRPRGR